MSNINHKYTNDTIGVAAIDLGTSYSGYAFCYKGEISDIIFSHWRNNRLSGLSNKAPSVVLFRPDKTFHSFGFDCEDKYASLMEKKKHNLWYMFRYFKMKLYDIGENMTHYKNWEIEDETGKKMDGGLIFKHTINFLRNELMERLNCRPNTIKLNEHQITWVLTVPAIWSNAAKKFMRQVSEQAGLPGQNLVLAYEPEVAAICCINTKDIEMVKDKISLEKMEKGTRFILLDIGGGTVDASAQEVLSNGRMRLLHYPEGGLKGGINVNRKFEEHIKSKFGETRYKCFQSQYPKKYIKLQRYFERDKRFSLVDDSKYSFYLPKELKKKISNSKFGESVEQTAGPGYTEAQEPVELLNNIELSPNEFAELYSESMSCISETVDKILNNDQCKTISSLVVIGGFAESNIVREFLRKRYSSMTVNIPLQPDLVVLKGAVLFGQIPGIVSTRVCRKTYGIAVFKDFDPNFHPEEKRYDREGELKCKDCFHVIFKINESVEVGAVRRIPVYDEFRTEHRRHKPLTVHIYSTPHESPTFTTDPECIHMADISINPPEHGWSDRVKGVVEFGISETEFVGRFRDEFGCYLQDVQFDFLI